MIKKSCGYCFYSKKQDDRLICTYPVSEALEFIVKEHPIERIVDIEFGKNCTVFRRRK